MFIDIALSCVSHWFIFISQTPKGFGMAWLEAPGHFLDEAGHT